MRKSSVGKSPKTSLKREKMDWERPAKSQNGRFGIHLATIEKASGNAFVLYRNDTSCAQADRPSGKKTVQAPIPLQTGNRKTDKNRLFPSMPPLIPK